MAVRPPPAVERWGEGADRCRGNRAGCGDSGGLLSRLDRHRRYRAQHLDCVDIFHLHNAITDAGGADTLSVRQVLDDVVPAFERLRQQGCARCCSKGSIASGTLKVHVLSSRFEFFHRAISKQLALCVAGIAFDFLKALVTGN